MKHLMYNNNKLMQGSVAYDLLNDKKEGWEAKLKKHLKELDQKEKELIQRYEQKDKQ